MPEYVEWNDTITFSPQTGLPQVLIYYSIPTADRLSSYGISYFTSVYEVSSVLLSALTAEEDRMFMFFANKGGVLIGASHGKYFSNSDIDYRKNNPLTNPPPVADFRTYTAVNSTDAVIRAAGWYLLSLYGWAQIPTLNAVISLNGVDYWITTTTLTSEVNIPRS